MGALGMVGEGDNKLRAEKVGEDEFGSAVCETAVRSLRVSYTTCQP